MPQRVDRFQMLGHVLLRSLKECVHIGLH
jgi:hypothetical protein